MKVILTSDQHAVNLKDIIKTHIESEGYQVIDLFPTGAENLVVSVSRAAQYLNDNPNAFAIALDAFGSGSFIAGTKHKGLVCAQVSDERSAYMTREHNNARMITMGSEIVGPTLAKNIASEFLKAHYDGGRHQIRVDMLNEMY